MRSLLSSPFFSRFKFRGLPALGLSLLFAASAPAAITNADLTQAALSGKAITCTITRGGAPCETSGTFQLTIDSPAVGQYTIAAGTGSTVAHTGTYTLDQYPPNMAFLNLLNYETGARVEFELRTSVALDSVALGGGKVSFGVTRVAGGNGSIGTGSMAGYKEGSYEIGAGGSTGTIPTSPADLSASALTGKTLNCTITGGNAPFESTGDFAVVLDSPTAGKYAIAISGGSTAAHTGAYTYVVNAEGGKLTLAGYLPGSVDLELYAAGTATANATSGAGKSFFEMYTTGANKHGTFTIGTSSGGGGGTPAPTIGTQPASQTVALGGGVTFTVTATGTGLSYQWYFNGVALSGQVNASLILSAITALQAGDYTVKITNAGGHLTSSAATLTVATPSNTGRIVNMSVRGNAGAGDQTLIVGLVIGGSGTSGTKPVLVRAIGPTLGTMGVSGFLADPKITAYSGGTAVATNDDWAGSADITAAGARLGAQPFASALSKDAAFYATPPPGAYSIHITGPTTGIAMAEIYDGTDTATSTTPRLVNVSVRAQVGTGDNLLITGLVIGGSTPRTVLLRALGPKLTAAGVNGVLANPHIALFTGSTKVAENDNWSDNANAATIVTTSSTIGADALVGGTKDAVLLVTLQPGVYAAHVTGVGSTTGVALVEIFEVP